MAISKAYSVGNKPNEFVSVLDYGATGNGTTDDTAALQAASDALNAAGGGFLYFPPGTYLISSPVKFYTFCSIIGAGRYRTKIKKTGSAVIAASMTTNLVCLDNTSVGDGSGDVNSIIYYYDAARCQGVTIKDITLTTDAVDAVASNTQFGVVFDGGVSEANIEDIDIQLVSKASLVTTTIFASSISGIKSTNCGQGISIENGTSLSIQNNYAFRCQRYGYFFRDIKYSTITNNACDGLNNNSLTAAYSDRSFVACAYRLSACYAVEVHGNGTELCYGDHFKLTSCKATSVKRNTIISPLSDYAGANDVSLFYIDTLAQGVEVENNFAWRNSVTALVGGGISGQHHDIFVDVASTNQGFKCKNNWFSNGKYDAPSNIFGNNVPATITHDIQGSELAGEFTPTMTLVSATGVSISYGSNNLGRYQIKDGWMRLDIQLDIASVTYTGSPVYPRLESIPYANAAAKNARLVVNQSANVTWPSAEPFYVDIANGATVGTLRNCDDSTLLNAATAFASGSTNVYLHITGYVYIGDQVNIV